MWHRLPRFLERAFQDFLTCGCLAAGFARFRCAVCRHDQFVAFSAWDHALCRAVIAVYVRAVLGWYRRQARMRGVPGGRVWAVVIVQRFGSALNLNVHLHAMVLDGVFARDADGGVRFHAVSLDSPPDLSALLVTIARPIQRLLARRGIVDDSDGVDVDPFADDAPTLAGLAAASVRGVAALGPRAGRPVRRWGDDRFVRRAAEDPPHPWHARVRSFDLHAGVAVPAGARERLERLCRYALRPAVGQDRVRLSSDGQVVLDLRRRWADGTTPLVFEPVEFLERLAALAFDGAQATLSLVEGWCRDRASI